MSRWDDLSKQIFNNSLCLIQTSTDIIKSIKDEKDKKDKNGKVIKTIAEKTEAFEKYLEEANLTKVDNEYVLNKFIFKSEMSRVVFNILEIIVDGKKIDDIDLLDLKDIVAISRNFIDLFDSRLKVLKKK